MTPAGRIETDTLPPVLIASPRRSDAAFGRVLERLAALGAVHSSLHDTAGRGGTFEDIAAEILRPDDAAAARHLVGGTHRPLDAQSGSVLGLCLHELATNAVEYGALSARARGSNSLSSRPARARACPGSSAAARPSPSRTDRATAPASSPAP